MPDPDPMQQIVDWLEYARANEPSDAEAMSVATVDSDGRPSLRMVLVRGLDPRGLIFYTNLNSRKGHELSANPWAALCFHWKSVARQLRVEGQAELVTDDEADAYFASRERESQIGAWASRQSSELEGRLALEKRVARYTAKFGVGAVPRPDFWSGYRVVPRRIEFWQKRPFRLHERTCYERDTEDDAWRLSKLYP